MTGCIH